MGGTEDGSQSLEEDSGIIVINLDGSIVQVSDSACRLHGFTREEMLGMSVRDLQASTATENGHRDLNQAAPGHIRFETLHRHKEGHLLMVEITSMAERLDGRDVFFCQVRDVSDRPGGNTEIRKLSAAVEQSPASVVITDVEGRIEYVNPKFTRATGYSVAEAIGQNPRILKSGVQSAEMYRQMWQTIKAGQEWRGEFHNKKKNGELFWEYASISPIRNPLGVVTHFVAVKEDITERKLAEEKLQLAYAELNQLIDSSDEGICVTDLDGIIIRTNQTFASFSGRAKDELLGTRICQSCAAIFCEIEEHSLEPVLQKGTPIEFDAEIRLNGERTYWLVSIRPYQDAEGKLIGLVRNFRNITERVRTQEVINRDLKLAGNIQRGFLPPPADHGRFRLETVFEPYHFVSGDVYDYVWDSERQLLTGYILDVMGHGLGTALQTAALRVLFRQAIQSNLTPCERLNWVNGRAMPYFAEDSFAAAFCFDLDFKQNVLTYSAAGINYFLAGTAARREIVSLPGAFLGMAENLDWEQKTLAIQQGDNIYFMTDGLFDQIAGEADNLLALSFETACNAIQQRARSPERRDDASALCIHINSSTDTSFAGKTFV